MSNQVCSVSSDGARVVGGDLGQPLERRQRAVGGAPALGIAAAGRDQLPAGVPLVQPQRRQLGDERLRLLELGHRLGVLAAPVKLVAVLDPLAPTDLRAGREHDQRRQREEPPALAQIEDL